MKKYRSAKDVFIYSAILVSLILLVLLSGLAAESYNFRLSKKSEEIELAAVKIQSEMISVFNYAESTMNHIGRQIAQSGGGEDDIKKILIGFGDNEEATASIKNTLSASMFSWVDKRDLLTVSSEFGVISSPVDMSKREYLKFTKTNLWKMYTGSPVFGGASKQWIVPAGLGVGGRREVYLGSVVVGFNIHSLREKFKSFFPSREMNFVIVNSRGDVIIESNDGAISNDEIKKSLQKNGSGLIDEFLFFDTDSNYLLVGDKIDHDLKVIVSYPSDLVRNYLISGMVKYLILFFLVILVFVGTVILLKNRIVAPLVIIGRAAKMIAQDNNLEKNYLPKTNIKEIISLCDQLKKIQQYKIELKAAKASQEKFFANMSHELRTPLNGIINFSQMMRQEMFGELNADYQDMLKDIQMSGEHLLSLVNGILDFAKMDAQKMELNEEEFDLIREIHDSLKIVVFEAQKNSIQLNVDLGFKGGLLFRADKRMMKQVVLNLISNAIKFTPPGKQIFVGLSYDSNSDLVFEIRDKGVGIKEEDMAKLVTEFGQVGGGYFRGKKQGSGLGLLITKKITELHGGKFVIQSVYGEGTSVKIILPKSRIVKV